MLLPGQRPCPFLPPLFSCGACVATTSSRCSWCVRLSHVHLLCRCLQRSPPPHPPSITDRLRIFQHFAGTCPAWKHPHHHRRYFDRAASCTCRHHQEHARSVRLHAPLLQGLHRGLAAHADVSWVLGLVNAASWLVRSRQGRMHSLQGKNPFRTLVVRCRGSNPCRSDPPSTPAERTTVRSAASSSPASVTASRWVRQP